MAFVQTISGCLQLIACIVGSVVVMKIWNVDRLGIQPNKILMSAMIAITLVMVGFLIQTFGIYQNSYLPHFLDGLLMSFYILGYLNIREAILNKSFVRRDFWHFLPVAIVWFGESHPWMNDDSTETGLPSLFYVGFKLFVLALYSTIQMRLLWKFFGEDVRSRKVQSKAWREWILIFTLMQFMMWVPDVIGFLLAAQSASSIMFTISSLALIAITAYSLVKHPEIYYGLSLTIDDKASLSEQALLATLRHHEDESNEGETLGIPNDPEILERLERLMEEDRPYLLQHFSVDDLAHELGIDSKSTQDILTHVLGLSFEDYLDQQRIFHCKERMKEEQINETSIEELGRSCGFKDSSDFINSFRRFASTDPVTYLKSLRDQYS